MLGRGGGTLDLTKMDGVTKGNVTGVSEGRWQEQVPVMGWGAKRGFKKEVNG